MKMKYLMFTILSLFFVFKANIISAEHVKNNKKQINFNKKILVYQFDIKEEIAQPVWLKTKKAFKEAISKNADIILIHMNTYGGLLETADSIRTSILQSEIPVWVFIDNNAASAGALISIACDSIFMRPGANIGAATVVDQTGKPVPDKYQSYMRSLMRSTAEQTGRNPDIAQGMVDPKIYIKGVCDSTQVITFTHSEAVKNGYCNGIANNVNELFQNKGIKNYEIVKQRLTIIDKIIGFLVSPFISGLLIMIIVGGIYFELQTPGIGFPIIAAVTAAVLYFAPLYLEGLTENWEILIFIIGFVLILLEFFVIPGFGIAGITGIILIVLALSLAMIDNVGFNFNAYLLKNLTYSLLIVLSSIFFALIGGFYASSKLFKQNNLFGKLALHSVQNTKKGYTAALKTYENVVGQKGISLTILRPAGKVLINNVSYDAIAEVGYIEKGENIVVKKHETTQLIVVKDIS